MDVITGKLHASLCPGRDLNPHGIFPHAPQACVSTSSTTWAILYYFFASILNTSISVNTFVFILLKK